MKFICIEIKPKYKEKEWEVNAHLDDVDRVAKDKGPITGLGFYWCPSKKGVDIGFTQLKEEMIKQHEKRIKELAISLKKLQKLELPREVRENVIRQITNSQ